jgi:glycosyltransferase involved in cell wall biosynthesis
VYKNYEIIIVDDGSSDSTVELVKTQVPTAKVIQQKNQGTLVARQTGIASAQGDLIAFLDQDDLWIPETLITEVNIFNKHPEIGLIAANMQAVDEQGNKLEFDVIPNPQSYDLSWERLLLIQPIATSTTLFRKDLVARIGG